MSIGKKKAAFDHCVGSQRTRTRLTRSAESLFHSDIGVERQPLFAASTPL
jgi:hypothetical protein